MTIFSINKRGLLTRKVTEILENGLTFSHPLSIIYFPFSDSLNEYLISLKGIEVEEYEIEPFKNEVERVLYVDFPIVIRLTKDKKYLIKKES